MNFVAEILSSAEKIEIENLNKTLPDILSTIDAYKQDVLQFIDDIYNKFSRKPSSNALLLSKANRLVNKIQEVEKTIGDITNNDVHKTKDKIVAYKQQLNESRHSLNLVTTLIHLHEMLMKLKICIQSNQYIKGIKLIEEIELHKNDNQIIQIEAFNGLSNKFLIIRDTLMVRLIKDFEESIEYSNKELYMLTMRKEKNINEVLIAIGIYSMDLVDKFIEFIWNMFCVIINNQTLLSIEEGGKDNKLVIKIIQESKKEHYSNIFKNIILCANFLKDHLELPLRDDTSLLKYISTQIKSNLSELIIENCLADTIPSNNDELQKYEVVVVEVEHLHSELIRCHIFSEDTDAIVSYVKNIDVLFIDKKCKEYMLKATEIMKRDLHDMIEIGIKDNDETPLLTVGNSFPYCFISKSTLDLLDLTDKIMQNAVACEVNAPKLYSTVQNIFHNYGSTVETHHQKLLQTIPQQVALFHNNCMYLSHKLSTWTEIYQILSTFHIEPILFTEKVHLLKQIGNRAFIDSLQQQINQIEDILRESGLSSLNTSEKLEPITEKSIRQCLRQQELLRTVWHKVLSHTDYNRSIGCILNFLCNFLINEILKVEDISSETGDQLVDIFKVILTRGPKLFTDPKDVHMYVKNWYRFNELVFILSSSLIEICDRWADSKGPLALQFKAEEVQKLIRALFQNTDRRAAVLAKIVK